MNFHEYRQGMEQQHRVVRRADKELRYTLCAAFVWLGVACWVVWQLIGLFVEVVR